MRFLHTSDWHLGKKLDERPRLEEQKTVLKSLVSIVKDNGVEIVIVSGDVFDTFTPSAEAEQVFFDTLHELTNAGAAVVVISGNHDDPTRLSASKKLSVLNGVFFSGGDDVKSVSLGNIRLLKGGKDHLVFENRVGEKAYVALLPYPTEMRMKEAVNEDESYSDKVTRYIREALSHNDENLPTVLVGHLFMLGGEVSLGERPIDLGGVRVVPVSAIPDEVSYTALGHLHKRQVVGNSKNIIYSGSILQYSFDESGYDKSVTIFDLTDGGVKDLVVKELEGYLKLVRINATSFAEAVSQLEALPDTYVELNFELNMPLTADETKYIVSNYPKAVIRTTIARGEKQTRSKKLMSDEELFVNFCREYTGAEPDEKVLSLYVKLINEIEVGE